MKVSLQPVRVTKISIAVSRYGRMVVSSVVHMKATTAWETIYALAVITEGRKCLYW